MDICTLLSTGLFIIQRYYCVPTQASTQASWVSQTSFIGEVPQVGYPRQVSLGISNEIRNYFRKLFGLEYIFLTANSSILLYKLFAFLIANARLFIYELFSLLATNSSIFHLQTVWFFRR